MKRTIFVLASILLISTFTLKSQDEKMPYGKSSHYNIEGSTNSGVNLQSPNSEGTVFYDDFEYYISDFDSDIWEIKRSSDINGTDLSDANAPKWFVCKPSNFAGNGSTYIYSGVRSAAISYTAPSFSWLIKKDFFLVESDSVELIFWLYYYNNATQEIATYFHLLIQEQDSQAWTEIASWDAESPSNQFKEKVTIPLTDYEDKEIRFAFVYENQNNSGYQLAVDDVFVGTNLGPQLNLEAIPLDFSYVPILLSDTMVFNISAKVINLGLELTDTIVLHADVLDPLETSALYTLTITDTISEGEHMVYTIDDTTDYSSQGHYTSILRLLSKDEIEFYGIDTIDLNITSNLFGTDYGIAGGFSLGIDKTVGNIYPIKKPVIASGIQIGWANFSGGDDPLDFEVYIYEINPLDSSLSVIYQNIFQRQPNEGNQYLSYEIENTYLAPGANYFVAIKQLSSTPIGIAFDMKKNGHFWSLNQNGDLERLANPSLGNLAIRLMIAGTSTNNQLNLTIDDGENPIEGALVHLEGIEEEYTTNNEGKVSVPLQNGKYIYSVIKEGFAEVVDTVKIFYASIDRSYTLEPEYKVTLLFNSTSKAPIPGVEILVSGKTAVTNDEGIAEVYLTEGLHTLTALSVGFNPVVKEIEVFASDNELSIEMEPGVSFVATFQVLDERQEPLKDVKVSVDGYGYKFTNEQGETIFPGMAPAVIISFSLYKNGMLSASGTFSIADEDVVVTQEMEYYKYNITFEVTNGAIPVYNAQITVADHPSVSTNFVGLALVEDVIPGNDIPFTVSKNGYATYNGTISLIDTDVRFSVVLSPSTSNPVNESIEVTIFPNPGYGLYRIEGEGITHVMVFDITGKMLVSKPVENSSSSVDLSQNSSGIYIVKIFNQLGTKTLKIVKL